MRRDDIETLLIDLIEGELSDSETRRVQALIDNDPEIRRIHDELALVLDASADPRTAASPEGWADFFYTRLKARMREEGLDPALPSAASPLERLTRGLFSGSPIRGLAKIAAAVVLINAIAWTALFLARPEAATPPGENVLAEYAQWLAVDESEYDSVYTVTAVGTDAIDTLADALAEKLAGDLAGSDGDVPFAAAVREEYYASQIEGLSDDEARSLCRALGEKLPDAYRTQSS